MVDYIRPHHRVDGSNCEGSRFELNNVFDQPVNIFISNHISSSDTVDIIIHFHGGSKATEWVGCNQEKKVVIATVNLGSGSSKYEKPLLNQERAINLFDKIENMLKKEYELNIGSTTITGFSAGYGAIRALLSNPETYEKIDGVILMDGLHTDYIPDKRLLSDGGMINSDKLDSFLKLAKDAIEGNKSFIFTHSSIFPGTYASTTECADYLINALDLKRRSDLKQGPLGMQQLGSTEVRGLKILAFAGNTAPDHVDHLHGLSFFYKLLME
jgi:hypothetical protein